MTILTVLEYPDKRLRHKALPVLQVDKRVKNLVADMFETMYAENGVGLAATQVNVQEQIIVIDISDDKSAALCIINPEILQQEGTQFEAEGCLSVPEMYEKVERAAQVTLRALDINGQSYEITATGLLAICIQHEMDHLNGVLFIDHLSKLKQDRLRKKLNKLRERV